MAIINEKLNLNKIGRGTLSNVPAVSEYLNVTILFKINGCFVFFLKLWSLVFFPSFSLA